LVSSRISPKSSRIWFRQRSAGESIEPLYDPALGAPTDVDDLDPAATEKDFDRLRREWRLEDGAVAEAFDDTFEVAGETFSSAWLTCT